jgi:hypothetical protein
MRGEGHSSWIQSVTFDPWAVQAPLYRFISVADDAKLCLWEYDERVFTLTLQRQRQHTSSQHIALPVSTVATAVSPTVNSSSNSTAATGDTQQHQQQHVINNAANSNSSSNSSSTSNVQQQSNSASSSSNSSSSTTSQPLNPLKRFSARSLKRSSDKLSSVDKIAGTDATAHNVATATATSTSSSNSSISTDSNTQQKHQQQQQQQQQQQHVSRGTSSSSITLDTKQTNGVCGTHS